MPFHQPDSVRYYTFDLFDGAAVNHGVITRRGGVSPQPWEALNVGGTVGDDPQRVKENRQRSLKALGRTMDSIYDVYQVHSADVVCSDTPRPPDQTHLKADAIFTDNPEVTLFMRFADCVPILLHDPRHKVVGLVHAGWMGTVRRTVVAGVQAM
jgi:purine-nucleoside/S-methyl-5'-thioadenosine phosphorylase / adenosine deaminase